MGTPETRRAYGDALREWFAPVRERLSADSRNRLETNPMRVLDSKDEGDLALLRGEWGGTNPPPLPRMLDGLDADSRVRWDAVLAGLDGAGIAYEIDHGLVRGLDYYTRTTFEVHDRSLGAQSALGVAGATTVRSPSWRPADAGGRVLDRARPGDAGARAARRGACRRRRAACSSWRCRRRRRTRLGSCAS
jgi:hypothetical protein